MGDVTQMKEGNSESLNSNTHVDNDSFVYSVDSVLLLYYDMWYHAQDRAYIVIRW